MQYKLGKNSMRELVGAHPILAFAVVKAIEITGQDFTVFDGVRTSLEQRKLVDRGVSKSNNSYHLYGLAVDLVPYVNGGVTWDEEYFPKIMDAMNSVIRKYDLPIENGYQEWGWDMPHWQLTGWKTKYDIRRI